MLSGISQERNARSRGHWFTEFCNSQRLSHFAAHFIGVRAKISATGAAPVRGRRQRRQPLNNFDASLFWEPHPQKNIQVQLRRPQTSAGKMPEHVTMSQTTETRPEEKPQGAKGNKHLIAQIKDWPFLSQSNQHFPEVERLSRSFETSVNTFNAPVTSHTCAAVPTKKN